jgi:hypothetical protein
MSLCIDDRLVCRFGRDCEQTHPNLHTKRSVTYTRCRIDTINSPDDKHMATQNMWRIEINLHEKFVFVYPGVIICNIKLFSLTHLFFIV